MRALRWGFWLAVAAACLFVAGAAAPLAAGDFCSTHPTHWKCTPPPPPLTPGETLTDPLGGVSITVVSVSTAGAVVDVVIG